MCKNIAIIDRGTIIEHNTIGAVLNTLRSETFILYLENPLATLPVLPGFTCRLIDPFTIEVDVQEFQNMNQLFTLLSTQNINILRMKNKSNRLEEFFIRLIGEEGKEN